MRDRLDELGPDTDVVLITFTKPDHLDSYLATNNLPFSVLLDPERRSYRSYGLGRASVMRAWGARSTWRYIQLFGQGRWRDLRRPTEDTLQLGGDFIVAPDGTLAYGFWSRGPDDRPSVDELIAAIS